MRDAHIASVDLNLLLLFHAVYVERSVSRAAERLGMTQSGVSHALAKLRGLFNDELFVRVRGAMLPTPRAEQLFDPVGDLIDTLENRILPVASFDPANTQRTFSVAMSDLAEIVGLPPLIASLKRRAPSCAIRTVRMPNSAIEDALEAGTIELALGSVYEPQRNIYQQTLYLHDYSVLAWKKHPRLGTKLSLAQYKQEGHLVAQTGSDDHLRSTGLAPHGVTRRIEVSVGGLLSIPWLLPDTELLATVPTHLARIACGKFPLRMYPLPLKVPTYAIKTYWHPRSNNDAGHRWFREMAYEVMHSYPTWSL
jgi:DNA-binding transcriptional LysR family regulator